MPVEAATSIATLNPAWPLGTDEKEEGDNHIRLIKQVLQTDFVKVVSQELVTFVKATNATFALNAKCIAVEFELFAGGGGSGALAASTASTMGVAGGGGGGERAVHRANNPNVATTWNIVVGAGGVAAIAGSVLAGTGGTTSISDGTTTVTALGGVGGTSATPASAGFTAPGGAGGSGGTGGIADERMAGKNGGVGTNAGNQIIPGSGCGGDAPMGRGLGGMNNLFQGPAVSGSGFGSGASGPVSNVSQPAKNGAAGQPGVVIVRQWLKV